MALFQLDKEVLVEMAMWTTLFTAFVVHAWATLILVYLAIPATTPKPHYILIALGGCVTLIVFGLCKYHEHRRLRRSRSKHIFNLRPQRHMPSTEYCPLPIPEHGRGLLNEWYRDPPEEESASRRRPARSTLNWPEQENRITVRADVIQPSEGTQTGNEERRATL